MNIHLPLDWGRLRRRLRDRLRGDRGSAMGFGLHGFAEADQPLGKLAHSPRIVHTCAAQAFSRVVDQIAGEAIENALQRFVEL